MYDDKTRQTEIDKAGENKDTPTLSIIVKMLEKTRGRLRRLDAIAEATEIEDNLKT